MDETNDFLLSDEEDEPAPKRQKKAQIAPAKNWVFTDHNASPERQAEWKKLISSTVKRLAFQVEICPQTKKEHLQGVFELNKKMRPTSFMSGPHYEKQKGTTKEAVAYATKEDTRKRGCTPFVYGYAKPVALWTAKDMCKCQMLVCDKFKKRCHPKTDRTVHWFWEMEGGWGKTQMALYLVDQHNAMLLQGASKDCLHGIGTVIEKTGEAPPIIIFDVPRVNQGSVSYQSIEALKNGCFFSGKYESGMFRFNRPHVLVFANELPDMNKLSQDRWRVQELQPHNC